MAYSFLDTVGYLVNKSILGDYFFFPEYTYARLHYLLLNGNPEALKYYYLDFPPENISIKVVASLPC